MKKCIALLTIACRKLVKVVSSKGSVAKSGQRWTDSPLCNPRVNDGCPYIGAL
jgi:hypothetical protein